MQRRPVPAIAPKRIEEIALLTGSRFKVERLLNIWNCAPDRETFTERAKEAGFTDPVITLFLAP